MASNVPKFERVERVAIIGATGRIGGSFARELARLGKQTVTAIVRKGSRGETPAGTSRVEIDYDDEESLVSILTGQQFLAITLPVTAPLGLHSKIVQAAHKAGIQYIMPNTYGYDVFDEGYQKDVLGAADAYQRCLEIQSLGMTYISMCCGQWYEWGLALGEFAFGFDIAKRQVTFFDDGTTPLMSSTWEQCGRAFASLLSLPVQGPSPCIDDWKNKPLYINSYFISQRDMLDSLHRVLGTTDQDWQISNEPAAERFRVGLAQFEQGMLTGRIMAMYSRLFFKRDDKNPKLNLANEVLKLPKDDLDNSSREAVRMVESGWNPLAH